MVTGRVTRSLLRDRPVGREVGEDSVDVDRTNRVAFPSKPLRGSDG